MPRAPSLWLSTVSAATSPARPLSIAPLLGGNRRLCGAIEPGGGDRLFQPLDFVRRQFDERRADDRRRLTPEQRQYLLHAVMPVEERRRIERLGERIDAL